MFLYVFVKRYARKSFICQCVFLSNISVFFVDISNVDDSAHLRGSLNRNSQKLTVQTKIDFLGLDEHEVRFRFRIEMFF